MDRKITNPKLLQEKDCMLYSIGGKVEGSKKLCLNENVFGGHFIRHEPDKAIVCGNLITSGVGRHFIERGYMDSSSLEFYERGGPTWSHGLLKYEFEKKPNESLWKGKFISGVGPFDAEAVVAPFEDGVQFNLEQYMNEIVKHFGLKEGRKYFFTLRHL
jgi:hypothetical protein